LEFYGFTLPSWTQMLINFAYAQGVLGTGAVGSVTVVVNSILVDVQGVLGTGNVGTVTVTV
jgi:hypothetical protein